MFVEFADKHFHGEHPVRLSQKKKRKYRTTKSISKVSLKKAQRKRKGKRAAASHASIVGSRSIFFRWTKRKESQAKYKSWRYTPIQERVKHVLVAPDTKNRTILSAEGKFLTLTFPRPFKRNKKKNTHTRPRLNVNKSPTNSWSPPIGSQPT